MARGPGFAERVRQDVLKRHRKQRTGRGRVTDTPRPVRDRSKTLAMHLLEQQHGKSIEELIGHGEIAELEETLGIDKTTVSKWRRRLGLR